LKSVKLNANVFYWQERIMNVFSVKKRRKQPVRVRSRNSKRSRKRKRKSRRSRKTKSRRSESSTGFAASIA